MVNNYKDYIDLYLKSIADENSRLLLDVSLEMISDAVDILFGCFTHNGKVLVCGNGGSATMSQHFVAELVGKFQGEMNYLPAIDLVSNTGVITSLANDCGYDNVFKAQIKALAKQNDVLFCMTTSGKSKNILKAIDTAKEFSIPIILLTGVASPPGCNVVIRCGVSSSTQRVQEIHLTICHLLVELLLKKFNWGM